MDFAFGIYFVVLGIACILLSANLWQHARWRIDQIMALTATALGYSIFLFGITVVS